MHSRRRLQERVGDVRVGRSNRAEESSYGRAGNDGLHKHHAATATALRRDWITTIFSAVTRVLKRQAAKHVFVFPRTPVH